MAIVVTPADPNELPSTPTHSNIRPLGIIIMGILYLMVLLFLFQKVCSISVAVIAFVLF